MINPRLVQGSCLSILQVLQEVKLPDTNLANATSNQAHWYQQKIALHTTNLGSYFRAIWVIFLVQLYAIPSHNHNLGRALDLAAVKPGRYSQDQFLSDELVKIADDEEEEPGVDAPEGSDGQGRNIQIMNFSVSDV